MEKVQINPMIEIEEAAQHISKRKFISLLPVAKLLINKLPSLSSFIRIPEARFSILSLWYAISLWVLLKVPQDAALLVETGNAWV